jgi:hypothetical protein
MEDDDALTGSRRRRWEWAIVAAEPDDALASIDYGLTSLFMAALPSITPRSLTLGPVRVLAPPRVGIGAGTRRAARPAFSRAPRPGQAKSRNGLVFRLHPESRRVLLSWMPRHPTRSSCCSAPTSPRSARGAGRAACTGMPMWWSPAGARGASPGPAAGRSTPAATARACWSRRSWPERSAASRRPRGCPGGESRTAPWTSGAGAWGSRAGPPPTEPLTSHEGTRARPCDTLRAVETTSRGPRRG